MTRKISDCVTANNYLVTDNRPEWEDEMLYLAGGDNVWLQGEFTAEELLEIAAHIEKHKE